MNLHNAIVFPACQLTSRHFLTCFLFLLGLFECVWLLFFIPSKSEEYFGLQEVVLPSCVEKLMVKQSPTLIHLRHAKTFFVWKFGERMYSVLIHLEPTWASLNLSWNNVCAGEQLGNHFKFVGTDLWTREPIRTYRNQVELVLCMEELGDGFSFVFVVCGVFGCCLTHVLYRNLMLWVYLVGVLKVFVSLSWKRFIWRSWKNVFKAWELFWRSLRTFECHCVLLCTTLLRRRVTELSNLCGLAQVRAVKKSCHAVLVFSHGSGAMKSL